MQIKDEDLKDAELKDEDFVDEKFEVCRYNPSVKVSQYGKVKTSDTGEILKRRIYKDKYFVVEDPSKKTQFELVHRLVALTWIGEKFEKGMVVHHIDQNGFNNDAKNLEWKNECLHASGHGQSILCRECDEECEYREYLEEATSRTVAANETVNGA